MNETRIRTSGEMLYGWLSGFAPTYRNVLPAGVQPEDIYIVYSGEVSGVAGQTTVSLSLYALHTTSHTQVISLADEMGAEIGEGGVILHGDGIHMKIHKGTPFYQDKGDEDDTVRAGYVNLDITIY